MALKPAFSIGENYVIAPSLICSLFLLALLSYLSTCLFQEVLTPRPMKFFFQTIKLFLGLVSLFTMIVNVLQCFGV